MEQRMLTVSPLDLAEDVLGFFRWGRVAGNILVTNDAGDWAFLTEAELSDLLAGRIVAAHPRFEELQRKGFLRDGLDLDALAARIAERNRHMHRGPHLHVVTLTGRGQENRAAAQPRENANLDMSPETAEKVVDLALQTSSPSLTFELQGHGGEPLLNFDVLRHLVDLARARNQRGAGKTLSFSVASNFSSMTEEAAEWLIANDVLVTTSLDGPASVHDWNRKWKGGSAHAEVLRWLEYFNRRYAELGRDPSVWHVDALMTTTRRSLESWREIVDEYVARGLRTIHWQPLNPAGVTREQWATIGYSAEEYLNVYRQALDYIVDLNRRGVEIVERMAAIFLAKILSSEGPGVVDIQSPCGAGTSEIAYNFDGRVFPGDEARVVDAMGDSLFELGYAAGLTIPDLLRHPTVRALAASSLLDAQPMCADCWNKPFCGVSPVHNFVTQGDLFAQRPLSFKCKEHMAVSAKMFELLANQSDSATLEILQRWATTTPRLGSDARASKEAP